MSSSSCTSSKESNAQRFLRIGLILFAFGVALLVGTLYRVYHLWTGGVPSWPVILSTSGIGLFIGAILRHIANPRLDKIAAIGCTAIAFFLFWDVSTSITFWKNLFQNGTLTYTQWLHIIFTQAFLWFIPLVLWLTFAWMRNKQPKGRLSIFVSACIGIIFTHFLVGRIATALLILIALCLMAEGLFVICSSTLTNESLRRKLSMLTPLLACLIIVFSPTSHVCFTNHNGVSLDFKKAPEFLAFYPFAPIAAQERSTPLSSPSTEYHVQCGAYLRTDDPELKATLALSQQLAYILKPAQENRHGFRPLVQATEEIKGQYDAFWIEIPPAWQADERDYFDKGVVKSLLDTVHENGYLIYHIDIRPLTFEALLTRAEALARYFPHVQLWITSTTHWQLVATRKALPTPSLPPTVEAFRVTMDLCSLKQPNDQTGFRLFETWHARKQLFEPEGTQPLNRTLVHRLLPELKKSQLSK